MDLWSRGRQVARGIQRSSPKPEKNPNFCHRRGIESFCRLFSTQQRSNVYYQTPGWRPPRIMGCFVNTVTREWVGAPNGRAPFGFHGAVVVFADRCMFRTQNLAASNKHLAEFFSGRSWPKIGLRKTQPNVCSKRRDSESWTDIERQNQRRRHEI